MHLQAAGGIGGNGQVLFGCCYRFYYVLRCCCVAIAPVGSSVPHPSYPCMRVPAVYKRSLVEME